MINPIKLITLCALLGPAQAATVWQERLTFDQFEGQPGGFDVDGTARLTLQARTGSSTRAYDVLQPGTTIGAVNAGQDGISDMWIKSTVFDNSGGRWGVVAAEKRRDVYQGRILVTSGTSRPGDSAIVAMEITFGAHLGLTADHLALELASVNGRGDFYEWAFVTVGGIDQAPFDPQAALTYTPQAVATGNGNGNGNAFGQRQTVSAFLTGATSGPTLDKVDGAIQPGWWAADRINGNGSNTNGGGFGGSPVVTGADMGLAGNQPISKVTLWFGFHDVASANRNGTTSSSSDQMGGFVGLSLGSSSALTPVPEPSAGLLAASCLALVLRRRRE